jgi:retron-type reverse transcriptase
MIKFDGGEHQKCGIKGRYIFENNIIIELLLNNNQFDPKYNKRIKNGTILSLDMEKAFDRVNHKYLYQLLDKINMGDRITKIVKLLYHNIHQEVETPYGYTNKIPVKRGIRQGSALSMILFTIAMEPFLQMINTKLTGIKITKNQHIKTLD